MKIIEKEVGLKVPYEAIGTKLFFNDELMINLSKYERDFEQTIDICVDENKCLAMGLAQSYIAQVVIPPRVYTEPTPLEEQSETDTMGMRMSPPEALPLDMEEVTLILWSMEGLLNG